MCAIHTALPQGVSHHGIAYLAPLHLLSHALTFLWLMCMLAVGLHVLCTAVVHGVAARAGWALCVARASTSLANQLRSGGGHTGDHQAYNFPKNEWMQIQEYQPPPLTSRTAAVHPLTPVMTPVIMSCCVRVTRERCPQARSCFGALFPGIGYLHRLLQSVTFRSCICGRAVAVPRRRSPPPVAYIMALMSADAEADRQAMPPPAPRQPTKVRHQDRNAGCRMGRKHHQRHRRVNRPNKKSSALLRAVLAGNS